MSGHNKWSTIKHKKGKADAARGRVFTRLIKEMTVAARMGGGDENGNPRLRSAVAAAKAANMPLDNITRAIKRGTGELEGVTYEECTYEGYGPDGAALLVDVVTDSKNRTVAEIRKLIGKYNGKFAEPGSVSWIFKKRGRLLVTGANMTEDKMTELALEGGADDVVFDAEGCEIFCEPSAIEPLRAVYTAAGLSVDEAGLVQVPSTSAKLEGGSARTMMHLMEALDEHDDVQNVWANADLPDDVEDSDE